VTISYPLLALSVLAIAAVVVAARLRVFSPPLPSFVPRKPGEGGEIAPPLLLGAFAAYSVSLLLTWGAALVTGRATWAPSVGEPPNSPPPLDLEAHTAVLATLIGMPAVVAIAWWARRLVMQPFDPTPEKIPGTAGRAILWGLLTLPMIFAIGAVASTISQVLGHPVEPTAHDMLKRIVDPSGDTWWRACLVATAVFGAPVIEEVCYRALLQRGLMTLTRSVWPAVIFSSLLFAYMHVSVIPSASFWPALTTIFSLSVMLGLLFARTGSVVTPIVVHSMFNAISIASALYVEWAQRTGGAGGAQV
jgi:membrane protease YdiL (CAAX protease family)